MSGKKLISDKPVARKKFAWQPTLDFYVLKEFLLPLGVLILGFIILFVVGDIFDDLGDFLEHKGTTTQIVTYFLLKMPGNIRFILPISVLLSCMYTMANFGKNLEITAMRASGISVQRCCGAIYLVAFIIAIITCWFNEALVPYTELKAYKIRYFVKTEGYEYKDLRDNLSYRSPDGRTTWLFNKFDKNGAQQNVFLKFFDKEGELEWDIKAKQAEYIPDKGWQFKDGEATIFDKVNDLPGPPIKFQTNSDLPEKIRQDIAAFPQTPKDIFIAVKDIENLTSWEIGELLSKSKNMSDNRKAIYWTTFFYRISFFPWAAIIAAFLGIPLATKNERSGIFMSIIMAVFIIMAYIVISEVFRVLGNNGDLSPVIAGMGPTLGFVIYGWYNVVKQD